MKKHILFTWAVLLALPTAALAGDFNFETTADGIAEKLAQPSFVKRMTKTGSESPTAKGFVHPKTRAIPGGKSSQSPKTRGIRVTFKEEEKIVEKTIKIPVKREGAFVNLKIMFDFDSHTLQPQSLPLLDELGLALRDPRLEAKSFAINGHTDDDGKVSHNLKLSLLRAESVKNYLTAKHGADHHRLVIMGYGEAMPLVPNDSPDNKQLNRRVELLAK